MRLLDRLIAFLATDNRAAGMRAVWRRQIVAYILFVIVVAAALWPSFETLFGQWAGASSYHHAPFAALLAFALILRHPLPVATPHLSALGLAPVLVLIVAWAAGRSLGADLVEHVSIAALLAAGVVLCFGGAVARSWAAPLSLLVFLVPFGESLTPALQDFAAGASVLFLNLAGVETAREGLILTTATRTFIVAPSCSGLNFLLAAAMTSVAFSIAAISGMRQRLLFVAAAIAIALLANALRIAFVVAAATAFDNGADIAADHAGYGWIFYALTLAAIILAGRRVALSEGR